MQLDSPMTRPADAGSSTDSELDRAGLETRLRSGDWAAFDEMVTREAPRIKRLAGRLMAWEGDLEDIVQEVFIRAWQNLPRYRGDSQIGSWLGGITVNVCRNLRRRQRLWKLFSQAARTTFESPLNFRTDCQVDNLDLLRDGLKRLRQSDREVLVLKWLEQRSIAEVATLCGVRIKTAEVRLQRAKQRLAAILEQIGE